MATLVKDRFGSTERLKVASSSLFVDVKKEK